MRKLLFAFLFTAFIGCSHSLTEAKLSGHYDGNWYVVPTADTAIYVGKQRNYPYGTASDTVSITSPTQVGLTLISDSVHTQQFWLQLVDSTYAWKLTAPLPHISGDIENTNIKITGYGSDTPPGTTPFVIAFHLQHQSDNWNFTVNNIYVTFYGTDSVADRVYSINVSGMTTALPDIGVH